MRSWIRRLHEVLKGNREQDELKERSESIFGGPSERSGTPFLAFEPTGDFHAQNQQPITGRPRSGTEAAPGGRWNLRHSRVPAGGLHRDLAYRGLHCPICRKQLQEWDSRFAEFQRRGCGVVAISTDPAERAEKTLEDWSLSSIPPAYELDETTARRWGLFMSSAISEKEPRRFAEPGIFLVRPDATLYAAWIQSHPFVRPHLQDLFDAIDFVGEKGYPPRGNVAEDADRSAA